MIDALGARGSPYVLGLARWYRALVRLDRREFAASRAECEAIQTLASEHGFEDLASWSEGVIGYIETGGSDVAGGLAKLLRGMAAMEVTGTLIGRGASLAATATARARLGERTAALALLDQAQRLIAETGELFMSPSIDALRAEVLVSDLPASRDEVYACLKRTFEVATAQSAVLWQIRALTGMVQLRAAFGGGDADAADRLRAVLSRLREGHDLPDVVLARQALGSHLGT